MMRYLAESVRMVQSRAASGPIDLAVILGSGLGGVAAAANIETVIPYAELPCLPQGQIPGHHGCLVLAQLQGKRLLFFQGRFHLYQGLTAREASAPVILAHALGCRRLLLTNASGGIGDGLEPGEFMLISDQINLMGDNPLRGELEDSFVSLRELYQQKCFELLRTAAAADGWTLHRGVICGMTGPSYETPAEIRMLRTLGADAVSMSTIPEAIMARYLGFTIFGLSLIANRAAGLSATPLTHDEVLAIGDAAVPRLVLLLEILLQNHC